MGSTKLHDQEFWPNLDRVPCSQSVGTVLILFIHMEKGVLLCVP